MYETINLLKNHRSIRKFQDKDIDKEIVKEIIESAQSASTSSFVQAYTIIGVKDKNTKQKLAKLSGNQEYIVDCPLFLVFCGDLNRLERICRIHDTTMIGEYTESMIMATVDAALAAQNAMIAAESLGLSGVYIGGIRNNPDEVSDLLKLPHYVYPVFGMCLGYPNQNIDIKPRLPMEVIYKEEFYNTENDLENILIYDELISEYYFNRTKGKRKDKWSEQIADKMKSESRPHMKEFLKSKGFLIK